VTGCGALVADCPATLAPALVVADVPDGASVVVGAAVVVVVVVMFVQPLTVNCELGPLFVADAEVIVAPAGASTKNEIEPPPFPDCWDVIVWVTPSLVVTVSVDESADGLVKMK
jgi:hypothetical protein